MLEQRLEQEIKAALLAGEKERATTLRGLKATLLNVKVAEGKRDTGLTDDEVIKIFSKQAKQRQESADLFTQGGNQASADHELREKALIEAYLPAQMSETEIVALIDAAIASGADQMGPIIGQVKTKAGASADGGLIARLVREKLA